MPDIDYVISTAQQEFCACTDEERKAGIMKEMIFDDLMLDSKEEFQEQFDDEDEADEEWEGLIICALNNLYDHIYILEAEIDTLS